MTGDLEKKVGAAVEGTRVQLERVEERGVYQVRRTRQSLQEICLWKNRDRSQEPVMGFIMGTVRAQQHD